jgi:hypothetical protein
MCERERERERYVGFEEQFKSLQPLNPSEHPPSRSLFTPPQPKKGEREQERKKENKVSAVVETRGEK